jgi:hypothetical protein
MSVQQAELPEIVAWRERIEGLYSDIRSWLAEMDPPPTIETTSTRIIEKHSGEYEAPMLLVKRGEGEFQVRPIAQWVVGADGRVDMEGGDGPFLLVWMGEKWGVLDGIGWFWVQDSPPWKRVPLTGKLFRGLAETCLER